MNSGDRVNINVEYIGPFYINDSRINGVHMVKCRITTSNETPGILLAVDESIITEIKSSGNHKRTSNKNN